MNRKEDEPLDPAVLEVLEAFAKGEEVEYRLIQHLVTRTSVGDISRAAGTRSKRIRKEVRTKLERLYWFFNAHMSGDDGGRMESKEFVLGYLGACLDIADCLEYADVIKKARQQYKRKRHTRSSS